MKILTLKETIDWMEKCITDGTDQNEDFWSNFSDAFMYLKIYQDLLTQMLSHKERKEK